MRHYEWSQISIAIVDFKYILYFNRKIYTRQWWHTNKSQWSSFLLFLSPCIFLSFFALSLILYHLRSDIKLILNFIFYSFFFILHILMYIGRFLSWFFIGILIFFKVEDILSLCSFNYLIYLNMWVKGFFKIWSSTSLVSGIIVGRVWLWIMTFLKWIYMHIFIGFL